jgi:hypothetical protein
LKDSLFGATTLSIKTLSITTFSIKTLSITTFSIKALSITTFSITTFSIKTFSVKGLYVTLSITIFSIKTHSVRGLYVILSITTFCIKTLSKGLICDTQHNDIQNKETQGLYVTLSVRDSQNKQHSAQQCYATVLSAIMASVSFYLVLC